MVVVDVRLVVVVVVVDLVAVGVVVVVIGVVVVLVVVGEVVVCKLVLCVVCFWMWGPWRSGLLDGLLDLLGGLLEIGERYCG